MSSFATNAVVAVFCAVTAAGAADAGPDANEVPRVAFLGFELINTSLEPTAPAEAERIRMTGKIDAVPQRRGGFGA